MASSKNPNGPTGRLWQGEGRRVMRRGNRTLRIVLGVIISAALAVLVGPGFASAKQYALYEYNGTYPSGSFSASDAVGGSAPFIGDAVDSIAVDQATNDVYVGTENGGGLLYKFNSAGISQPFSALAPNTVIPDVSTGGFGGTMVDNSGGASQGRIFQWNEGTSVKGFLATGEAMDSDSGFGNFPLAETGDNCGGDIAPNGNIWVTNYTKGGVYEYTPSGEPTTEGPAEGFISALGACSVAIDSNENFYTSNYNGGLVRKFSPSGEPLGTVDTNNLVEAGSLAVDRSNDHLFVDYKTFIKEFDADGGFVEDLGFPDSGKSYPGLQSSQGMAVDETTHVLYVTDRFPGRVDTFVTAPPLTIPDTVTGGADITATEATLHGTVDPDSAHGGTEIVSCEFKWGTDPKALTNTASCDQPVPMNSNTAVTASIGGLSTGSSYFFQITAKNSDNGILSTGAIHSFQPAGPPLVTETSVSDVHSDGATLSGSVDPQGGATTWDFEYGKTEAYGSVRPGSGWNPSE